MQHDDKAIQRHQRTRGRPRQSLNLRFPDAVDFWDAALGNGSAVKACNDINSAIHFQHQLNQFRKALRDSSIDGVVIHDNYIVRREDHRVIVLPRPRIDLSDVTTIDGRPIDIEQFATKRDPLGNPIIEAPRTYRAPQHDSDHNPFPHDKPLKLDD